ncbi:DUF72 domain-containing protein [Sphingomonas piscis]|uniref:DUF72 domain-containing protein n=1 Tax=Sphingomonas piscis TaxID=2714943 RepID=UPI001FE5F5FC|nr:DUF72 domain-containing protein [Sphingomonas piscis]
MPPVSGIHVGCSGWVYRHWKEGFYPPGLPQKRWFEHYADEFGTVEINASFYRLPLPSTFDGWREKAPPGFRYAVKANRFITHLKKLAGCESQVDEFIDLVRRLGPALGPILYQLPPSLHKDLPRLDGFLRRLPTDLEHVVEFRHASWYDEEVLALLESRGAGFVAHDLKDLVSPRWASGRTAYVRFHGTGGKYWGRYSEEQMADWAAWLREQRARGRSAWAYFNNDIHLHAIEDARTLARLLAATS